MQKTRSKSKKFKGLKVLKLRSREEVILSEDCRALFTTEPARVKMLIRDIIDLISDPFPSPALMQLNADLYQTPEIAKKVMLIVM